MPRIIRLRYHVDNLPEYALSTRNWLELLTREELVRIHEWCEPWPLLWTLSDREAVTYCRRYHDRGPAAFLTPREPPFWLNRSGLENLVDSGGSAR